MNWIIVSSKDRGTDYGVGTFIKQLSKGFLKQKDIKVFVLEIGTNTSKEFCIEKNRGITYLKIPPVILCKPVNTIDYQQKLARSVVRVLLPLLSTDQKSVVHLNYVFQCFIGEEFKKIGCNIIFTQHLILHDDPSINKIQDVEYRTYSLADKIIAVTNHGREHLIQKSVDGKKIDVIYNGIDPGLFLNNRITVNIREKYGIRSDSRVILFSGRLETGKGLKYLIKSFSTILAKIPESQLVIAGDENYEENTPFLVSSNILFLGFIPFEDLKLLYKEATIGVIPSLEEQCSYVALEMLHSGLPVIATKIGGLKEIFIHDENAFQVDTVPDPTNAYGLAPNTDELSAYMYKLLTDEQLRKKFSRNAIRNARKKFSMDKMSFQYAEMTKALNEIENGKKIRG